MPYTSPMTPSAWLSAAAYFLPDWVPGSHYVALAHELGLKDVRTADWSEFVVSQTRRPLAVACSPKSPLRLCTNILNAMPASLLT